ncbi:hypothetical protein [Streptomyces paromomycinus]|uniref:Uncharacterized protein n=1 Tax=Streptomyces paromomycinus TaxID=92743 RepID=A0A401W3B8_STREY|nr:hypothetical protein [Streptomyces paromomycinus]GCD43817.1 hypothetical protein GKJPGBOP_03500 [Streptomyces paromomycinus]
MTDASSLTVDGAGPAAPGPADSGTPPLAGRPRRLRRVLPRVAAAVVVCGLLGTGIAYGITSADRTGLPGLGTPGDGRWPYPEQHRPPLPPGAPAPFAKTPDAIGGPPGVHHADLGGLRLTAPEGATVDLDETGGQDAPDTVAFTAEYEAPDGDLLRRHLAEYAPRRTASRGWTMPDGTRARVHMIQFESAAVVQYFRLTALNDWKGTVVNVRDARTVVRDEDYGKAVPERPGDSANPDGGAEVYRQTGSEGGRSVRYAYLFTGDTLALLIHSRPGSTVPTAFYQSVALQQQLLS